MTEYTDYYHVNISINTLKIIYTSWGKHLILRVKKNLEWAIFLLKRN